MSKKPPPPQQQQQQKHQQPHRKLQLKQQQKPQKSQQQHHEQPPDNTVDAEESLTKTADDKDQTAVAPAVEETVDQLHQRLLSRLLTSADKNQLVPDSTATAAADALARVTHARLDRANLVNLHCFLRLWPRLPSQVNCCCVTHLYLQHNQLESLAGIECLPALAFLAVAHNRLRSLAGLAEATPRLRFLDASHNAIERLDPAGDLPPDLLILCLQGNSCHGYRRAVLAHLAGLRQLDLRIVSSSPPHSGLRGSPDQADGQLPSDSSEDDGEGEGEKVDGEVGEGDTAGVDDIVRMLRVARQCLGEEDSEEDDEMEDEEEEEEEQEVEGEGEGEAASAQAEAVRRSVRGLATDILLRSQSRLESDLVERIRRRLVVELGGSDASASSPSTSTAREPPQE